TGHRDWDQASCSCRTAMTAETRTSSMRPFRSRVAHCHRTANGPIPLMSLPASMAALQLLRILQGMIAQEFLRTILLGLDLRIGLAGFHRQMGADRHHGLADQAIAVLPGKNGIDGTLISEQTHFCRLVHFVHAAELIVKLAHVGKTSLDRRALIGIDVLPTTTRLHLLLNGSN